MTIRDVYADERFTALADFARHQLESGIAQLATQIAAGEVDPAAVPEGDQITLRVSIQRPALDRFGYSVRPQRLDPA